MSGLIIMGAIVLIIVLLVGSSIRVIGANEVGLVRRRYGPKLPESSPVALKGEAGYQADLLMPGWRWKFCIPYSVEKFPWVQIPSGEIGVVISQIGKSIPVGAKSAKYSKELGDFSGLRKFIGNGGEKGVQRPVLPPGTLLPIHPVGFLVLGRSRVYGKPISSDLELAYSRGKLKSDDFGIKSDRLYVTEIKPRDAEDRKKVVDSIGVVTTFEGDPLPPGDIASRLNGFEDISQALSSTTDSNLIEMIIGSKNKLHNNYQDFQAFLDNGGKIGLQHDPLLYGAYNLNPFLVKVDTVPMLVVEQGEVAVIKSYVGLMTDEKLAESGNYGNLVRPGYRGIWREPLRTGKYAIVPNCYQAEIVPISIMTLNWSEHESKAYQMDTGLRQIIAKSREGFIFSIDLQVQIHVPDDKASKVIAMVGTMVNLVGEVLQAAVGNHFRDRLQSMPAVDFIETRQQVQEDALQHIREKLNSYEVETLGVYIQDVKFPDQLVVVLTEREIANQEIETFKKKNEAQTQRIVMEKTRGTAEMQVELAKAQVGVDIQENLAQAKMKEADGAAYFTRETGKAEGEKLEAIGVGKARGYEAQVNALGKEGTSMVNMVLALAEKNLKFVPEVMVGQGGNALDALAAAFTKKQLDTKETK